MLRKWIIKSCLVLSVLCLMILVGCAKPPNRSQDLLSDDYYEEVDDESYGPLDSYNNAMFEFNDKLYNWVFFPIADTYRDIVPDFVQTGLGNFFYNLSFPVRMVGDIFQLNGEKLKSDSLFFVINTTTSLGFYDFRSDEEKARDSENISQSLAYWGIPSGPVIVLPFFGPSNIRDMFGMVGDIFLTPSTYLGFPNSTIVGFTSEVNKTARSNPYREIVGISINPYEGIVQAQKDNFEDRLAR